jgi:hypothetical protein
MSAFRLSRRAVLRGAGSIAIALPWLEIMGTEKSASGAGTPAQRFLTVFQPGGSVIQGALSAPANRWKPTGTETAPVLSSILAPLEPVKNKIIIVDGLDMVSAVGEQHQAGIIALLTGTPQNMPPPNGALPGKNSYATGPSVDQIIADRLQAQKTHAFKSLEFAVRWATGKSHGLLSPINVVNFENNATFDPIPPRLDPAQIFTDVFGSLMPDATGNQAAINAQKKSILDFVDRRFTALSPRLGTFDKQKIDQHLTKIRDLEQSLTVITTQTAACKAPAKVDTTGYNPRSGLNSAPDGSVVDSTTDSLIPKIGTFMMDMMVMAMACDLTAVGTMQWTDTEAKHTFPWLKLSEHHHFYQHDGGFRPTECEQIDIWYSTMHLHLIQSMAAVDMGGHSLLDESVVFFGTEIADPPTHKKQGMPFLLAGNGGGLRTGRWVQYNHLSHNQLLVAILNLFGDMRQSIGPAMYNGGPLTGLT